MTMENFRSGYVTIIGRPNVGKSTLLNKIMGEKLSIISNKPQTTRNTIQAILTKEDYQIIFLDTPGIHKPKHKLGEYMVTAAKQTLNEVDVVLFMTTPDVIPGPTDKNIIEGIRNCRASVILVINKTDTVKPEKVAQTIKNYISLYNFDEVVPISAYNGENIDELTKTIVSKLPYGPKYFPDDMITDQQERFIAAEIIREKILKNLNEEVPHGTAVEIISMKEDSNKNLVRIDANIYCEKESHKAIIIGKSGKMLKVIGQEARLDIENFLNKKVYLELWVKVKKDWRDDNYTLKTLGYRIKT